MIEGSPADRRQSVRYAVNRDLYLTFGPSVDIVGRIMDVSGGGMAVEYTLFDNRERLVDTDVSIFAAQPDRFMLCQVPCKVVYDTKIAKPTLSGIESRRCGLKFESLSKQQTDQLQVLLSQYVSHPLPVGPG